MKLNLDESALRCAWGGTGEYWFSHNDYKIHSDSDLKFKEEAELLEEHYIPFVTISNEEIIRAYIRRIDSKKLSTVFHELTSSDECVETFWKYYNAYTDISSGFNDFEKTYVLDRVVSWCNVNQIEYVIV